MCSACRGIVGRGDGVCERTPQTADRVIVLLSMDSDRVLKEFRR